VKNRPNPTEKLKKEFPPNTLQKINNPKKGTNPTPHTGGQKVGTGTFFLNGGLEDPFIGEIRV